MKERTGYDIVRPDKTAGVRVTTPRHRMHRHERRGGPRLVRVASQEEPDFIVALLGGAFGANGSVRADGIVGKTGSSWRFFNQPDLPSAFAARDCVVFNDELYVVGSFNIGGGPVRILKWDDENDEWVTIADDEMTGINVCVVFNGQLVVGGLAGAAGAVRAYNGAAWSDFGSGTLPDGEVSDLVEYENNLHALGSFTSYNGIARSNGGAWGALGGGLELSGGPGQAFVGHVFNGDLIVGGKFDEAGGLAAENVASWDGGTWAAIGAGITLDAGTGQVRGLSDDGTTLYASTIHGDGAPMVKYDVDLEEWVSAGESTTGYSAGDIASTGWCLHRFGDRVLLGADCIKAQRDYVPPEEVDYGTSPLCLLGAYNPETGKYEDDIGNFGTWSELTSLALNAGNLRRIREVTLPDETATTLMFVGDFSLRSTAHCWGVVAVQNGRYRALGWGVQPGTTLLDGGVRDMHKLAAGDYVMVGNMGRGINRDVDEDEDGSVSLVGVGRFVNNRWEAYGSGVTGLPMNIAEFDGTLWLAGLGQAPLFRNTVSGNWDEHSPGDWSAGDMYAVRKQVGSELLHVGGAFQYTGLTSNLVWVTINSLGVVNEVMNQGESRLQVLQSLAPFPSTDIDHPNFGAVYAGGTPFSTVAAVWRRSAAGAITQVGSMAGEVRSLAWIEFSAGVWTLVAVGSMTIGVDFADAAYLDQDGSTWHAIGLLSELDVARAVGAVRFRGRWEAFITGEYAAFDDVVAASVCRWNPTDGVRAIPFGGVNGICLAAMTA